MSSLQPASKDKAKLGDSLPRNAINPGSLGSGGTDLAAGWASPGGEGLKAGASLARSRWDQGKGLVGQSLPFPTRNLQLVEQDGFLCLLRSLGSTQRGGLILDKSHCQKEDVKCSCNTSVRERCTQQSYLLHTPYFFLHSRKKDFL